MSQSSSTDEQNCVRQSLPLASSLPQPSILDSSVHGPQRLPNRTLHAKTRLVKRLTDLACLAYQQCIIFQVNHKMRLLKSATNQSTCFCFQTLRQFLRCLSGRPKQVKGTGNFDAAMRKLNGRKPLMHNQNLSIDIKSYYNMLGFYNSKCAN